LQLQHNNDPEMINNNLLETQRAIVTSKTDCQ